MKKIIALMLLLCMSVFVLASCANISKFEDKLEDEDYEVDSVKEKEVKAFLKTLKLDIDDYKVKDTIEAESEDGDTVIIIKCGMFKSGKLVKDLEKAFKKNDIGYKVDKKGAYVFFGDKSAIKDAMK